MYSSQGLAISSAVIGYILIVACKGETATSKVAALHKLKNVVAGRSLRGLKFKL